MAICARGLAAAGLGSPLLLAAAGASIAAELLDRNGQVMPGTPDFLISQSYDGNPWHHRRVLFGSDVHRLSRFGVPVLAAYLLWADAVDAFPGPAAFPDTWMAVWENATCSGSPKAMIWWRVRDNSDPNPTFLNFYNNGGAGDLRDVADARFPMHPDFEPGDLLWWTTKRPAEALGQVASCRSGDATNSGSGSWDTCYTGTNCSLPWGLWPHSNEVEGEFLMTETVSTGLPRIAQPVTLSTASHAEPPRTCSEAISPTGRVAPDGSPIYCTRIEVPIAPGEIAVPHGIAGLHDVISLGGTFHGSAGGSFFPIPYAQLHPRRTVTVKIDGAALRLQVLDPRATWGPGAGFVEVEFTLGP